MSCGCKLSQTSRSRAVSPIVAIAILAAPVLGAVLYMGAAGESHARVEGVSTSDIDVSAEGSDWARLATSTLDGSSFAMADLTGKPTILYFWATWCPQCKIQREVLNTLSREWGDRARIAALTVDDDIVPVKRYLEAHASLSHELRASPELLRLFGVEGLPTLVVIDAKGRIQSVSSGLIDGPELRRSVTPLLP
jgi:thiol-disulfide isomerase/thioredoxin